MIEFFNGRMEGVESQAEVAQDDLPPPAYTPPAEPEMLIAAEQPQEDFVAEQQLVAGSPTPEALARLKAAIGKSAPSASPQPEAAEPAAVAPQPTPEPAPATGRLSIGSLIGRMAGQSEPAPAPTPRAQPSLGARPRVESYEESAELDPEQERIEIPAFLRRQAN